MRKRVTIGVVLLLVVALVGAGLWWWRSQASSELVRAAALAPAETERLTWTDWGAVRAELDAEGLDAGSSPGELTEFLDAGYEEDLTSASVLLGSAAFLQAEFGFSPASLEWELLSQSVEGSVVLMRLPDGADLDGLRDGLEQLGYQRPTDDDGVWDGGEDLISQLDPNLTPQLQYLAVAEGEHLVLASDTADHLAAVVEGLGDEGVEDLDEVLRAAGDQPLSAVAYVGDHVCTTLAMSAADAADQAQAEDLLAAAGEVNPMTGYLMAELADGRIRVAMSFESDDQARTNADSRGALARGPAPGQGGSFADRFRVEEVSADGPVVTMDLDPVEGEYVLSDLSAGPVLFATC